ncbi:hypothetical protein INR49_012490 [Caranx melampygus]|nr:hypothetical protein INR49_012490 [Caranx melampygus]
MDSPAQARKSGPAVAPTAASAPDGGYAWFISLSGFVVFGLTFGVIKAFGVFYVEITKYFEATATETSWITSIAIATIHILAPVASALSARFSHRSVVITGGLICSFGVLLIDNYSWRGALVILGGLQLNLCVCGMLLRPLEATRDVTRVREVRAEEEGLSLELLTKEDSDQSKANCQETEQRKISEGSDQGTMEECLQDTEEKLSSPKGSECRTKGAELGTKILRYVDFTLITNVQFMVYSMFGVFAALGFFAPALFLVPYARSKGIEEYQAAALMSISAVLDLFGRLFFGWVANLRLVEMVQQLTATVILLGTVLLLCPLASSFSELAAVSTAYGLVFGAVVSIHITVLAEVVGVHRLGSALGFFMLIRSSGGLLGPPIAGYFIDKMSDYGMGFIMAGAALIASALFLLLLRQINRKGQRSNTRNHNMHMDKMGKPQS